MRIKWFSVLTFVMCSILIVFLASCFRYERKYTKDIEIYTPPQPPSFPLQWAVGPEGSRAYQLTMQIVQSEEMDITPLVTKGSLDSLEKIASGRTLLATVRADHAMMSYQGNNQQVRTDAMRVICALNPLTVHILIKTTEGKNVSLTSLPAGATIVTDPLWEGGSYIARQLFRAIDRDPEQFEYMESTPPEWLTNMQQENVLAAVLTAPAGNKKVKELLESGSYRLASFPQDDIGDLLESQSFFLPFTISENMYPYQKEAVQTAMLKNLLLVRVDYPAEKVEEFCKIFFTCYREYCLLEKKVLGLARALEGVSIPLHQGALRFYRSRFELFTGDPLGTYYDLGIYLSGFFNQSLGPLVLPRKSSGSIDNINAIERLYGQLAFIQSDIAYRALLEKSLIIPEAPHLRAIAAFAPENMHLVVKKGKGIRSLSDVVGKNISLGALGSGTMLNAIEMLKEAGIFSQLKREDLFFLDRKRLLLALDQDIIDCFFTISADPSDALTNLMSSGDYYFVSLPPDLTERLVKKYPYYFQGEIPKGYYPNQNSSINTISTIALMVAHKAADPEIIKNITTLLGEHIGELSLKHPQLKGLTLSDLWTRSSIPFHRVVSSVVSEKGWPIQHPQISLDRDTGKQTSESAVASSPLLTREVIKAVLYPKEAIVTEEAIDEETLYFQEGRERRFMTLQEATLLALRENLSITIQANTPLLSQLEIAIQKAQFYPSLLIDSERSVNRLKDIDRSDETAVGAAIEEKLPSGTTLKLGSDWITGDSNKTSRDYRFSSFFEITQPLLEGMGLEVNLADYYIAREGSEIALESFRGQINTTLTDTRSQYYEVLRAFQNLQILKQSLELARDQLKRTAALVKVGKYPESELTVAQANVSQREDTIIVARKNYRDQEDILLELLHAEYGYSIEPVLQLPLGEKVFTPIEPFAENFMRAALTKRPDVRNALANVEVAVIQERVAKNAVLPGLDLRARVFNDSGEWDRSYQAFKAFEDYNDITFTLGLSLDLPIPNTADQSAFTQAQINRRRTLQELQQLKETVQKEVRESIRRVNSSGERIPVTKKALLDAEKQIAQEILKFRDGKTDNYNVFNALGNFTNAQLSELNALVDYYQAVIGQDRVLGVTDERLKIRIYDTLSTHPRFNDAFGQKEQKALEMRK